MCVNDGLRIDGFVQSVEAENSTERSRLRNCRVILWSPGLSFKGSKMKGLSALILTLVVSGCASQSYSHAPIPVAAADESAADESVGSNAVICKMEKPTGSNRPVRVCRAEPGPLDDEQTERDLRALQRQSELLNK